jgi:S-adenosylmethionine/arginine decarboxylase-like enzyme
MDGWHEGNLSLEITWVVISNWLDALVKTLEMKALTSKIYAHNRDWLGIQLIAESHISIHAKPDGRVWIDIFSCKAFDPKEAIDLTADYLELQLENSQLLKRELPIGSLDNL